MIEEKNEADDAKPVGEFVGELLHAVTVAHIYHLRSESFAQHSALGAFYDALGDKVDAFAETYQGCYGLIDGYPTSFELPDVDPKDWALSLAEDIVEDRKALPQDSELQNIVDEILACVNTLIYKLAFLR